MNKAEIIEAVLSHLEEDLRRLQAANEDASAGATHSESRAETKWDTCGLESSYLARGHAMQFQALAANVDELRAFPLFAFSGKPIGLGALIEVEQNKDKMLFFLLPCAGGIDLDIDGREVTTITPESPVGVALLEKSEGEPYSFRAGLNGTILSVT